MWKKRVLFGKRLLLPASISALLKHVNTLTFLFFIGLYKNDNARKDSLYIFPYRSVYLRLIYSSDDAEWNTYRTIHLVSCYDSDLQIHVFWTQLLNPLVYGALCVHNQDFSYLLATLKRWVSSLQTWFTELTLSDSVTYPRKLLKVVIKTSVL